MISEKGYRYEVHIGKRSYVDDSITFEPSYLVATSLMNTSAEEREGGHIIIMNDCRIEKNAIIRGNVIIGSGAFVGAGSVITKNVPPYAIVEGNPSRIVGYRFPQSVIDKLNIIRWWNWESDRINQLTSEIFDDVRRFVDKYEEEAKEKLRNLKPVYYNDIKKLHQGESKRLLYVLDVESKNPIYDKVIENFVKTYNNTNFELVLYLEENENIEQNLVSLEHEFSKYENENCYVNLFVGNVQDKICLFPQVDAYIVNHQDDNVEYVDCAELFNIPILMLNNLDMKHARENTLTLDTQHNEINNKYATVELVRLLKDNVAKNLDKIYYELEDVSKIQIAVNNAIDNLKYELFEKKLNLTFPYIEPEEKAIEKIIKENKSICRFGDGEFSVILGVDRQRFQSPNKRLGARLLEVLNSREDDVLICIANNYGDLSKYNLFSRYNIRHYMTEETRAMHYGLLDMDRVYYDAYLSRPYVDRADNSTDGPQRRFEALKQIWNGKKILIVEGEKTRMGVGNDLFSNSASIKRILCPAENSFDRYGEILEKCKCCEKDNLVLIALGATATVLAYDLAKLGYQALDVGHIDLEYEWMKAGQGKRVPIRSKYNNEVQDGYIVDDINDSWYEEQIIARIY
ncbi:MAG: DUF1792 domain-containing protein [Lachnospiraceae bacterium]|nr:DUF1792 domain-containing protein [Lachnospiraceae bacterium]